MKKRAQPFATLMQRAGLRVCDVRDLAGVDYTTARRWKLGKGQMTLTAAAAIQGALNRRGIKTDLSDYITEDA